MCIRCTCIFAVQNVWMVLAVSRCSELLLPCLWCSLLPYCLSCMQRSVCHYLSRFCQWRLLPWLFSSPLSHFRLTRAHQEHVPNAMPFCSRSSKESVRGERAHYHTHITPIMCTQIGLLNTLRLNVQTSPCGLFRGGFTHLSNRLLLLVFFGSHILRDSILCRHVSLRSFSHNHTAIGTCCCVSASILFLLSSWRMCLDLSYLFAPYIACRFFSPIISPPIF